MVSWNVSIFRLVFQGIWNKSGSRNRSKLKLRKWRWHLTTGTDQVGDQEIGRPACEKRSIPQIFPKFTATFSRWTPQVSISAILHGIAGAHLTLLLSYIDMIINRENGWESLILIFRPQTQGSDKEGIHNRAVSKPRSGRTCSDIPWCENF